MITERDLPASTARDDYEHSPSRYINAYAMAERYKKLHGRLTTTRAMDPSMAVVDGSRSSDGMHNQMCERADLRAVLISVQGQVTKRRWEAWVYYRLLEVVYREIPKTNKRTAERDVKSVDRVVDNVLEDYDMLGD